MDGDTAPLFFWRWNWRLCGGVIMISDQAGGRNFEKTEEVERPADIVASLSPLVCV